ncbi:hypothetical protein V6N13_074352 [Hibiscus sabdariffa]|uniref:Uncharacterized protein n=1 Tax=Hibiscus sabdariffa TaxID=183260 RepID=A0ABR2U8A5_9ROSI
MTSVPFIGEADLALKRRESFVAHQPFQERIHPLTLKQAFANYRWIMDVYIAFKNPRRRNMRSMFTFIRFAIMEDALKSVKLGNNRRIDDFIVKMFLEIKHLSTVT